MRIGNAICTVIDATRTDITLQIPANAQPNTDLTIQGGEMAEPVAIPYMNPGFQIFDFNDWPGSGGFTHSSQFPDHTTNFLCDGTEGEGYPEPLNEGMKYLRFHSNVGAWGWMVLWAGYIQVPAEVAAIPLRITCASRFVRMLRIRWARPREYVWEITCGCPAQAEFRLIPMAAGVLCA